MNDVQVDYQTLVEVMQEKLSSYLNQIIALEARVRAYNKALTEALNNVSEPKKPSSRRKSVDTETEAGDY